jgi:hypothetical protein
MNTLKENLAHIMRNILYNLVPSMAPVPNAQHPCDESNFRPVSVLSYPALRELQLRQGLNSFAQKQTFQVEIQQTSLDSAWNFSCMSSNSVPRLLPS